MSLPSKQNNSRCFSHCPHANPWSLTQFRVAVAHPIITSLICASRLLSESSGQEPCHVVIYRIPGHGRNTMTECLDVDSAMLDEEFQETIVQDVDDAEEAIFAGLAFHVLEIIFAVVTLTLLAFLKKKKAPRRRVRTRRPSPLPNRRDTVYELSIDDVRIWSR